MRSHWHRNVLHRGDPQTPQGIHFTGLEAMLSTDRMWRSRLFGGTRTLPSLPERDFLGVSLVIRISRQESGAITAASKIPAWAFPPTLALSEWRVIRTEHSGAGRKHIGKRCATTGDLP